MTQSRKRLSVTILVLPILFAFSGCAVRKEYVQQQVDAMKPAIKEAMNSSKETAERLDAVDKKTQQAISAAEAADQKATQANTLAQSAQQMAQSADTKGDTANQGVEQAASRLSTIENRIANLGDNYTASQKESVRFAFNSAVLTKDAEAILDKFVETASSLKSGYTVEIQGFTDSTGTETYNVSLSELRANNVQRYLLKKGVPLYRISVLGSGQQDPIADNKTKDGRDHNRRVEVTLLKLS